MGDYGDVTERLGDAIISATKMARNGRALMVDTEDASANAFDGRRTYLMFDALQGWQQGVPAARQPRWFRASS